MSWTVARVPEPDEAFSSIWASSVSDAWVATTRRLTHWNGTSWNDVLAFDVDLVWGVGPDDVWATSAGRVLHSVGGKWREEPVPAGIVLSGLRFYSFAGVTADDVWAFGGSVNSGVAVAVALHWDGSSWTAVDQGSGLAFANRTFESAWAAAADDVWMSGLNLAATELWHWDGLTWTEVGTALGGSFGALSGTAANDIWSVGKEAGYVGGALRHFDGTAWSTVFLGDRQPTLVAASRKDDVWAFATAQSYHLHHACNDGAPAPVFSRAAAPTPFVTMVALSSTDLWGFGVDGDLEHWDGSGWTDVASPFPATAPQVRSMAGGPPDVLWLAGQVVMRRDGSSWTDVTPPNGAGYDHLVWGHRPDDIWVRQSTGLMFHWDGSAWLQTDFNGVAVTTVFTVASSSPTDAWALGESGVRTIFAHWDGVTWTVEPDPGLGNFRIWDAVALSPSNVWALAMGLDLFDQRMLHYDGSRWSVAATTTGDAGYAGVWASSASDVWATLPQGGLWHYDGSAWSTINLSSDYLYSVTGSPAGDVWASGHYLDKPVIYHHSP
ncbi:MAG TPA: hypothetical protein VN962_25010 [Polyangia bacterium]|nr:hypothetical protein [Polyangia bacterium]